MKIDKGRIINDFIEPNKRQYAIPVYQRNYEWSKEQCVKLFEDIVQAYKKDGTHFCGSVVYAPLKEEQNIHYYIIIDGQQRLTTIYLLLKALIDLAENDATRELIAETLKLKPIKSDDNQLRLLMENKYDDIEKNSGIWRNYELFCSLVQAQLDAGMYVKDIYKGVEKLICASIILEQEDNAQEMFERINSTGVPLSLADKIRNFVLMTDADQESLYENYWLKAEVLVHRNNMTAFFLDYLNTKVDGFAKEEDAYEVFKDVYRKGKYTNESMLKEILHYADFYHAFLYGDKKYGDKISFMGVIENAVVDHEGWSDEECEKVVRETIADCGMHSFIPCIAQGGPGSVYPGVYLSLAKAIDKVNQEQFGFTPEEQAAMRLPHDIMF